MEANPSFLSNHSNFHFVSQIYYHLAHGMERDALSLINVMVELLHIYWIELSKIELKNRKIYNIKMD